jgi:hypothetical protein
LANAVVVISISGPEARTLTSGPSDSYGIAEAKWKIKRNTQISPYTATVTNVTADGHTWDGNQTSTIFTVQ